MLSKVRFGVVGAGSIATLTARDIRSHPAAELIAVADPNVERAAELASRYEIPNNFQDARDLFARDDIDAVYLAVPNAHHAELATAALDAGKHVLLDKPFALNLATANEVAQTAQKAGKTLMLGMNQRFERNVQRARLLHRAGRLGNVYHAKAFWRRRSGIPRIGSWFTHRAVSGGGALLDIGVHMLDAALYVLDNFKPVSVSGASFTRFGNRGRGDGAWGRSEREFDVFDVDDFAVALIRLEGGVVVTLDAAWALHQPTGNDMGVLLYGDDAGMSVYEDLVFHDGENGEYHATQNASTEPLPYPHCSRVHHFINVLRDEEAAAVTVDEALAVQAILDAIYQSAATGREVRL